MVDLDMEAKEKKQKKSDRGLLKKSKVFNVPVYIPETQDEINKTRDGIARIVERDRLHWEELQKRK
jgi:hypothetical protein